MTGGFERLRRIGIILLTFALVAQPIVGTAVAQSSPDGPEMPDECKQHEEIIYWVTYGQTFEECDPSEISDRLREVRRAEIQQTKIDLRARAYSMNATAAGRLTSFQNTMINVRGSAWTHAETAMVQATVNNSTAAEIEAAGDEAINEYFALKESNALSFLNGMMIQYEYAREISENESLQNYAGDGPFVYRGESIGIEVEGPDFSDTSEYWTLTLANGSTQRMYVLGGPPSDTIHGYPFQDSTVGHVNAPDSEDYITGSWTNYDFNRINESDEVISVFGGQDWGQLFVELRSARDQMLANVNTTAPAMRADYQDGEFKASEYLSAQAAARDWANRHNETGYQAYAMSYLANTGSTTPNLSDTAHMNIEYLERVNGSFTNNTTTYEGILLSSSAPPGGTWNVSETYNPDNIDGLQQFYLSDSSGDPIILEENFTIVGAQNKSGGELTSVSTRNYTYQNENYDELATRLDTLIELRAEQQARVEDQSGGGSGGGGINLPGLGSVSVGGAAISALLALGGILLVLDRTPGSGS